MQASVRYMFKYLKEEWRELKKGAPGNRFRQRCERARRARKDKSAIRRFVVPVVGVLLLAVGVAFCILPGPGLPLVAIGGAMLAQQSMTVATALDWLELTSRYLFNRGTKWWRNASLVAKNVVIVLAAAAMSAVGYGAYQFLFRH